MQVVITTTVTTTSPTQRLERVRAEQGRDKSVHAGVREGDETCRGAQLRSFVCLPPPREHFCLLRDKKGEGEHTSCP